MHLYHHILFCVHVCTSIIHKFVHRLSLQNERDNEPRGLARRGGNPLGNVASCIAIFGHCQDLSNCNPVANVCNARARARTKKNTVYSLIVCKAFNKSKNTNWGGGLYRRICMWLPAAAAELHTGLSNQRSRNRTRMEARVRTTQFFFFCCCCIFYLFLEWERAH